ncbi:hypothetical protein [Streptomyces sp. cg35]|uniref:hypothetical protein n=1 Tax=Streptomyces sp. cg35 TaxID=3421650 RepID=UPI003D168BE6
MPHAHARVQQALTGFDDLAWFGAAVPRHPLLGHHQVPFAKWRFRNPRQAWTDSFTSAVRDAPTRTAWTFRVARNWMIAPTRLVEDSGPAGELLNEAAVAIARDDQGFCAAAQNDMIRIIDALGQAS